VNDKMAEDLDKIEKDLLSQDYFGTERKEEDKHDFDKTWMEKAKEKYSWILKAQEWDMLSLDLIYNGVILAGAYLMFQSIYHLTESVILALLSVSFSEAGIKAWHKIKERPKNSEMQIKIAKSMRNWHIVISVLFLITNFVLETSTSFGFIITGGELWIIFGGIGLTSLLNVVNYFRFRDYDKELSSKKQFQEKLSALIQKELDSRLEMRQNIERIKLEAMSKMWQENADKIGKKIGEIEGAKILKNKIKESGLSDEDFKLLTSEIFGNEEDVESENEEGYLPEELDKAQSKRVYKKSGQYSKKKKEVVENFTQQGEAKPLLEEVDSIKEKENQTPLLEEEKRKLLEAMEE
jgi:hypothetical protein